MSLYVFYVYYVIVDVNVIVDVLVDVNDAQLFCVYGNNISRHIDKLVSVPLLHRQMRL
jgi:hypothetical protein